MRTRGLFLVIEGPNGAGKGTLLDEIERRLAGLGHAVQRTREPGGSDFAERLRPLAKGCRGVVSDFTAAMLFNTARSDNCRVVIRPALDEGRVVLCDRWNLSTKVFQVLLGSMSASEALAIDAVQAAHESPDVTLIVLPSEEALRARTHGAIRDNDSFEVIGHARELGAYWTAAKAAVRENPDKVVVIDVSREDSPADVSDRAWAALAERFALPSQTVLAG